MSRSHHIPRTYDEQMLKKAEVPVTSYCSFHESPLSSLKISLRHCLSFLTKYQKLIIVANTADSGILKL